MPQRLPWIRILSRIVKVYSPEKVTLEGGDIQGAGEEPSRQRLKSCVEELGGFQGLDGGQCV